MSANKAISPQASARIQRWSLTLSMYQYSLKLKSSLENRNADALTRLPLVTVPDDPPLPSETILLFNKLEHAPLSADYIREWTSKDPVLSRVMLYINSG